MENEGERISGNVGARTGNVGLRLTYATIAARLGISGDAARMLVRRRGWQRIQPNRKGAPTIVVVAEDELDGERWRQERTSPDVGEQPPSPWANETERGANEGGHTLLAGALAALEDAVQVLREQLAAERQGKERAEAAVAGERSRSDVLRSRLDEMIEARAEADRAIAEERLRADAAYTAAQAAQQAPEALRQADAARRARGVLTRLRAAWRGE